MPSTSHKTGALRQETLLLPARVEDYVGPDNMARAIEAFVASLDLVTLKFCHAVRVAGAGQPPYHPSDLLKLYLYGYLNQIRSSRRLEREAGRNVEQMWLLRGLLPSYRTIANFRRDNVVPLKQVSRDFVMLLRGLDLLGGEIVAIDGAFFDGNASKGPEPRCGTQAEKAGRFGLEAFSYDAEANEYVCPQGKKLRRQNGYKTDATLSMEDSYISTVREGHISILLCEF